MSLQQRYVHLSTSFETVLAWIRQEYFILVISFLLFFRFCYSFPGIEGTATDCVT